MPILNAKTVNNIPFNFQIHNKQINFLGVSVSDPDARMNTSIRDTAYVLNKNTKSVLFEDIQLKSAVLRNRNLTANDKNLVTTNQRIQQDGDFISISTTFLFKDRSIGKLEIRYPYSYYIKENVLILPFQSFPVHATYTVLDPGVLIKHYHGQSLTEPERKTGILDVNFIVKCLSKQGVEINEDLTISVNVINGGFVRGVIGNVDEDDNGNGCENPTPAGTFAEEWCDGCNRIRKYHDGNCGFYTTSTPDNSYCGCEPPAPSVIYVRQGSTQPDFNYFDQDCDNDGRASIDERVNVDTEYTTYHFYSDADGCNPITVNNLTLLFDQNSVENDGTTGYTETSHIVTAGVSSESVQTNEHMYGQNCLGDPIDNSTTLTLKSGPGYQIITATCSGGGAPSSTYAVENNSINGSVVDVMIGTSTVNGTCGAIGFFTETGAFPVTNGMSSTFAPAFTTGTYTVKVYVSGSAGSVTVTAANYLQTNNSVSGNECGYNYYEFTNVPCDNIYISVS